MKNSFNRQKKYKYESLIVKMCRILVMKIEKYDIINIL